MSTEAQDTGHEYDGIREHDNKLPRWWLFTLYGAIAFSFGYWLYFHGFEAGLLPRQQFAVDAKALKDEQAAREAKAAAELNDDTLLAASKDPAVVARGKEVYVANCQACHGARGEGLVGPNMTDAYWLHGSKPLDNLKIISEGFAPKGMPAWKPVLGMDKVKDVEAFLLTLRGKNETGKAPEGVDESGNAPAGAAAPAPAGAPAAPTAGG
jgi:cytochrome c oxidase cbb3-type subunit 3